MPAFFFDGTLSQSCLVFRVGMLLSSLQALSTPIGTVRLLRLLLLASLIAPMLAFAGAAWQEHELLLGEAAQRAEKAAEVLEQHSGAAFHAYELIFARVDEHLRAAPDEDEVHRHAYLAGIDNGLKEVGSLFLVDAEGRVTAHSRYLPVKPTVVVDRDYFRTLVPKGDAKPSGDEADDPTLGEHDSSSLDTSGLSVGEPNVGRLSGTTKLNIARAITSPDGRFAGAIVISVAQEYFEAFHRKLAASNDDSMALIRSDGAVLARSPELTGSDLERVMRPQAVRATIARLSSRTTTFTSPLDGVERIATYRKLPEYPIFVGYGLSTAAVLATWYRHLVTYAGVAAMAAATLFSVTLLASRAARQEALARADLVSEMARREAAEAALRQSQKMEAIGQLTGGIAHDFNNLLAAILGNLELLAKRLPEDPRMRRYIEGALEGTRRGAGLTRRMLAFARRQELSFEAVDVQTLIRAMSNLLERSLGPAVEIETRFPVRLPAARADANQLEASLLNLVVNARDAMARGGRIIISGREAAVGLGSPAGLAMGHYVVLAVSDTGEGMDAGTLARATEPFFTTKAVGKGTGLGLAMVHGLATQSGGTLRIESEVGQGTTVEIWLPVAEPGATPSPAPIPREADRRSRALRILLVDDDELVRTGTSAMLEDLGHIVTAVGSATEALGRLREGVVVDVVITDYAMPGMNGVAMADRLRSLRPDVPVLLASGYAEMSDEEASRLPRLAKPFTQSALAQAISELFRAQAAEKTVVPLPRGGQRQH